MSADPGGKNSADRRKQTDGLSGKQMAKNEKRGAEYGQRSITCSVDSDGSDRGSCCNCSGRISRFRRDRGGGR